MSVKGITLIFNVYPSIDLFYISSLLLIVEIRVELYMLGL